MEFAKILSFLSQLKKNNHREWFEKNKAKYLEAKALFEDFVAALLGELAKFNDGYDGLDPKKLTFRIYRDVRFSKDKRPYKVNMGAGFSPGGKMIQEPGYYLHIEPGQSFVAAGLYQPDAENLGKVRQEIDYNSKKFEQVVGSRKFKKVFGGLDDFDMLKTAPKGYPKDHPFIGYLKHRSFIVSHSFSDKEVKDRKFLKQLVSVCQAAMPFNQFLKEAIA